MSSPQDCGGILVVTGPIGDHRPTVTDADVANGLGNSPTGRLHRVDFNNAVESWTPKSWDAAIDRLAAEVTALEAPPEGIFAIGPIPLLAAVGRLVGDKNQCTVFERHRHSDSWTWEAAGDDLGWSSTKVRGAAEDKHVVVLLSVSGQVRHADIPAPLRAFPAYELEVEAPRPNLVQAQSQLAGFAGEWRELLNAIRERHGSSATIHLLPACPVSVAVELGRRLLPKVDPKIRVYDWRGNNFHYVVTLGLQGVWREREAATMGPCDLLFLIALSEEFEQLFERFPDMEAVPDPRHGHSDFAFDIPGPIGQRRVVARLVGGMGVEDAQLAADRALERWNPRMVVNIGIAASLHDDVKLGDVVVANQVDAWDANLKAVPDGGKRYAFQHRGAVFHGRHALIQAVERYRFEYRAAYLAWASRGKQRLIDSAPPEDLAMLTLQGALGAKPDLHLRHLASGSVVGAAEAFAKFLKLRDASLGALEMEAAGMVRAAEKRQDAVPWLVVRGISDLGDERKSKLDATGGGALRSIAMVNALELVLDLSKAGLLDV